MNEVQCTTPLKFNFVKFEKQINKNDKTTTKTIIITCNFYGMSQGDCINPVVLNMVVRKTLREINNFKFNNSV